MEASQAYINGDATSNNSFRNILEDSDDQLTEEERIIREMDRDLPTHSNSGARRRALNLSTRDDDIQPGSNEGTSEISSTNDKKSQDEEVEKISIKLKFLNDEIKIDNHAHLNESVLSFKR